MAGSAAALRRLGVELRKLRESTGRKQTDVGAAIGRTHASLVSWELGKTRLSKPDLICLLAELGASDRLEELDELRRQSGHGGRVWATYELSDRMRPLVGFEQDAVAITVFEPIIIPGMLQTEAYAKAIHQANPHTVPDVKAEKWSSARIRRQDRLMGDDPVDYHVIIGEPALRNAIGGVAAMQDQLEYLAKRARQANVTVQVLPLSAGAHPALGGNFNVLHFGSPDVDPPLGYFDGPLGGHMVHDPVDVTRLIRMFADLEGQALSRTASTKMIAAILEETRMKGKADA